MAVPTALTDLSQTASSNPPSGATSIGAEGIDDHLRAGYSFIAQLNAAKAPIASPTFTGTVAGVTAAMVGLGNVTNESKATMFTSPTFTGTVSGISALSVGLGNVTNESKATMFTSPTFTGTVAGVTASMVGLGNVTNESKATMFTSPTFTTAVAMPATVTGLTAAMVSLGNVTNESKSTMFTSPTFTGTIVGTTTGYGNTAISALKTASFNGEYNAGTNTALTPDFANGQKQYCTMGAGTTTITLNTGSFPGVGHYQLRIIQDSTARSLAFSGTAYDAGRWLNDADANDVNSANGGQSILSIFWNGTVAYLSMAKVGTL